jgi:hypothetical protein
MFEELEFVVDAELEEGAGRGEELEGVESVRSLRSRRSPMRGQRRR